MLVLARGLGQSIVIDGRIVLKLLGLYSSGKVALFEISAPIGTCVCGTTLTSAQPHIRVVKKITQWMRINEQVDIQYLENFRRNLIRLGVIAPHHVTVDRLELHVRKEMDLESAAKLVV